MLLSSLNFQGRSGELFSARKAGYRYVIVHENELRYGSGIVLLISQGLDWEKIIEKDNCGSTISDGVLHHLAFY
jgi:hypothetical protein